MDTEILNKPSFANIRVKLEPGYQIIAEADAMASMSSTVDMQTRWSGGVVRAELRMLAIEKARRVPCVS